MADDLFLQTLLPTTHDLGGFKVHRTLPHRERTTIGPFIFFDQMGPAQLDAGTGIDVRPHPHINLATVTYLFAGAIDHRDSLGTFATIEPGAVNLMTAGTASPIASARPPRCAPRGPELSGIQTWLALPTAKEEIDPAFEHVAQGPLCRWSRATAPAPGSSWAACGARSRRSPATARPSTPTSTSRPAARCRSIPEADERALYVAEGEAALDGAAARALDPLRAAPRHPRHFALGDGRPRHALRRRAARRAAPRLLEFRLLQPRADQPGQGGLEGRPLRAAARRP